MKTPDVMPKNNGASLLWRENWQRFARNSPGLVDHVGEETHYWGKHLFLGWETHNRLFRASRAVGIAAPNFCDAVQYQDVRDLRAWQETAPAPLLLHEDILSEHCYIVGPSGAGKTSLGIMPLLIQLMRGAKTTNDELSAPYPVVILDLKGDHALFHTVRLEAERRGQVFKFFRTGEKDPPTYRFNPFRGFDRTSRTIPQLCQLIMDALSLNHGKGYGRSYYTERSRNVLARALKSPSAISSFDDLYREVKIALARTGLDARAKTEAFELVSVIEMLCDYPHLVTGPKDDLSSTEDIIFMPELIEKRQVAYFWLPAALESISVAEIAKLVLFNLRVAADDWKQKQRDNPRRVILVIDELQRVAGENLQGILQDARAFGISAILANQSLADLKLATGFDLASTIMTNTRVKFFFTSPSEKECYVFVERGKGFTEARPFPARGNPWLRDLAPEEFGYHTRLSWPMSQKEYSDRDHAPLPDWEQIPGKGEWRKEKRAVETPLESEDSDVLPHAFDFIHDEAWQAQVTSIEKLFADSDPQRVRRDDAIDDLLAGLDEKVSEEDDEEEFD